MMSDNYILNALFNDVAVIDGDIYFYSMQLGFLRKSALDNEKVKTVYVTKEKYHIDKLVNLGSTLYAFDIYGKNILIYDIHDNSMERVSVDCGEEDWGNYVDVVTYEEMIYIISNRRDIVYRFDTNKKIVEELKYNTNGNTKKKAGVKIANEYWLFLNNGEIVVIDLERFESKLLEIKNKMRDIRHCYFYGNSVFALCASGQIWELDVDTLKCNIFLELGSKQEYIRVIVMRNKMILLPLHSSGRIVVVSKNTKECNVFEDYPDDYYLIKDDWSMFSGYSDDEEMVVMARRATNYSLVIDKRTEQLWWKNIEILTDDEEKAFNLCRALQSYSVIEDEEYQLEDYIRSVEVKSPAEKH